MVNGMTSLTEEEIKQVADQVTNIIEERVKNMIDRSIERQQIIDQEMQNSNLKLAAITAGILIAIGIIVILIFYRRQ